MLKDIQIIDCTLCVDGLWGVQPCPVCHGAGEYLDTVPLERITEPGEARRYSLHTTDPEYYR